MISGEFDCAMTNQVSKAKLGSVASCMTCPLCHELFRDATTIIECLHTFCRKCIFQKLLDEEMECCPVCNIDLGCAPLEKLRPDHNLQDIRAEIFPYKRTHVQAPEVATPVTLPAKRKERSLSSLVVSTPRVSTQNGMTGRRSKSTARKASRGSSFIVEKHFRKEEDLSHHPESSSLQEIVAKFIQIARQNLAAAESSNHPNSDKGRENGSEVWEGKLDLNGRPLTCLVEAASRSKSSKFTTQESVAKSESHDNERDLAKTKHKENRLKSEVQTQIDLLMDEVNKFAEDKVKFFDKWVELRTVTHFSKMRKKGFLQRAISLENSVLRQVKTKVILEALHRRQYFFDLMRIKKLTRICEEQRKNYDPLSPTASDDIAVINQLDMNLVSLQTKVKVMEENMELVMPTESDPEDEKAPGQKIQPSSSTRA